jgi:hypothetical protein
MTLDETEGVADNPQQQGQGFHQIFNRGIQDFE